MRVNTKGPYFPPRDGWALAQPQDCGLDPAALAGALELAANVETPWPRSLTAAMKADPDNNEPPPWNEVLGPTLDRGGPSGLIVRHGYMVGAYGEPDRVEMTFSIAKSYLSLLTGIALRKGVIRDLDDPVRHYALDDGFESPQNRDITWRHFLHQSSEWEGTLFSKPDLIDRNRQVGSGADNSAKGTHRDLRAPGDWYEYNDVRVNRFSLSLMQAFRQPLAAVLREHVMEPIGASDTWAWHPYRNSEVEVDGVLMPSVPGGAHWGGGIFIHSEDHARVGLLVLNDGVWDGRRLLPEGFVEALRTPSPCFDAYGFLWWLNTARQQYPSAPESSFFAMGAGTHLIWVDPTLDLVAVFRWIDRSRADDVIAAVMRAIQS
ncbi:MAG: serine hydrolase [Pseudomonadota bacterium]